MLDYDESVALAGNRLPADPLIPRFYLRDVQNQPRSAEAGRPIFDLVPYVEILMPGQRSTVVDRKVTNEDKARWPAQWDRFEKGLAESVDGTPLEQWALLNRAQVAELRALNIRTVEQVAALDDAALQRIGPGARDLQKRARQHLAPPPQVERELRAENKTLMNRIAELEAKIGQIERGKAA